MTIYTVIKYYTITALVTYILLIIYYNIYGDKVFHDKPENNTHYVKAITSFIISIIPLLNIIIMITVIETFINGYDS